ncbi:Murein hydrolase activator EnvC [hydrothermal vent metagenome]|uniref:Murein hydrolase activator EnvC n=1 Tax=hydrothermal vent metagenome TaxID=652676 RepID=A0A3B0ZYY4_9ZZZZ
MINRLFRLFVALGCLYISSGIALVQANSFDDDSKEQSEQELQQLKVKIKNLRIELDEVRTLHDKVRQELRTTEISISKRVKNLNQLKRKLRRQNKRLRQLQQQRRELNKDVVTQRDLLGQQVRTAYTIGKQEYLKLLLNQENPNAIGRVLTYYEYFNQARSERIDTSTKTLRSLAQIKKRIRQENKTLQNLKQQQLAEKKNLEAGYQARAIVIAKLSKDIEHKDGALQQMLANEKQLERVLNVITESMPEILTEPGKHLPFATLKGKLYWPALGTVKNLFGRTRKTAKVKWNGVIIKARQGNNVRAISHGRVAYADWLRGYGLLMIIDHGDGYMSLYGHNEDIRKETGDWVDEGEIIGSVGNTGGQAKAGLYFEIRKNGKPANPKIWCRKVRRG